MDDHSVSVKALRCLELYSGIGGMHCALEGSLLPFDIVAAADINPVANSVYQHNFPNTRLLTKCLTTLTVGELDSYKADMILMSPPCQPFTRVGKRRDIGDERTQSFLHLLQLLPMLNKKPDYILVENVQGFEQSVARDKLVDVLNELDYSFQELMLSPVQFGIPNSRLRYYLIAKRKPLEFHQCVCSKICCTQLSNSSSFECLECTNSLPPVTNCSSSRLQACCDNGPAVCCAEQSELSNLMENDENDGYLDKFLVPRKLFKYFWVMDLVSKLSKNSCCFTKRYGRLIEGSGSVVQMSSSNGSDLSEFRDIEVMRKREEQFNDEVAMLRLRFFTPREIANILCFPKHFVSNGSNQSNSPMDSSEIGCNDSYQGSTKFNVEPAIHDSSSHHNYKLIVDPAIHGGVKKVYRHNGIFPGDAQSVHVYDPRSRMRWFATKKEALDLIVPSFTIDEHYIGAPREVTFINLNNNINIAFLKDMCKQFGRIGSAEVFYHPKTRRHLGIGKVVFSTSHAAQRCVDKLNQTTSMGNLMTVTLDLAGRQRRRLIADLTSEKDKGLGLFCPPCPTSALPADLFAATSLSNDNSVKQLDNSKNKPGKVKSERPKQNQNNSSKSEHKHAEPVEKAEKTLSVVHNSTSAWKQEFDENTLALMQTAESAESATHDRQKSYNQRSSLDSSSTAYPVTNVDYRPEVINDSYIGQQQHEQQQSSYWKSDRMQVKHDVEANMATSRWSSSDDRTEQQADQDLEGSHLRNYHSVSDRKRNRNGSDVGDRHSIKSDRRHQQDNGSHHSRHHDNHSRDSENYRHGSRANNRKDDDRYNDQWYNSNKQQGDRYQMDQGRSNRQSNYDRHRDSIDGHGHRQRYDSDRYNRRSDYSKPDNYSRRVDDRNRSNERKNKLVASDWRKSPADRPWQPTDWKRNSSDTLEHALDQSKPSEDHFSAMNNSEITDFETMPYDMPANESCEDGLRDLTINEHMIRPPSLDSRIQSLLSQTADADPNTASLFNSVQFFSQDSEREEAGTVCPEQTLSNIPATASISDTSTLQPAMDFGKKPEHQYSSDRQAFDNKVFGCEPQRLFSAPPPGAPFLPDCNLYPQPPSQQLLPTVDAAISSDCNDLPCTSVESSSVQPLLSVGIDSNDRFGRDSRHSRHGRDRQSRCRDRKNSSSRDDHGMDAASYGHDVKRQQQGQWHVEGSTGYNCAGSGQWQPTVEGPQLTKTQEELGNWQTTYGNQNCDMGGSNQWTSQQSDFSSYDQSHMQPESAVDHWQNLQNQQYCSNQGFDNTSHQQQQQVTSEGALAIQSYQNNEQNQMSPIDRWFLRQSDGVIEELVIQLKLVLIRDLKKKMIESTGFRGLDDWWNARLSKDIKKTAVDVNKASVAIANDSTSNSLVENPSSSAAPINDVKTGGKQPMTSLTSLFENMDNSGVGLGGLLGIRSGAMAQLPSFRRKVSSAPEPAVAVPASTVVTHDKREARSSQKAAEEEDRNRGPHTPDRSVVSDNEEDNSHDESDRSIDESSSESESDRAVLKIGSSRAKVYSSSSSSSSSGGSRSSSSASSTSSSGEESDDESGIEEEPKKAVVTRKRTTIRNLSKVYVSDDEDDDDDDDDNDEDDDDDQENEDIEEELKTAMAARRTGVNKFSNVYDSDDDEEEANDVHEDLAKALPESGDELPAETGLQSSTKTAARDKLEDTKLPTKSADSVDVGALLKPVNKMKSPDNIVSEGGLETVGGSNVKKEVGYEIEHLDDIDVVGSLSPGEVKEEPDHSCKAAADTKESSVSDTGAVLQANGSSEAAEKVTATEPSSLAQPHVSPVKSLPPPSSHVPIQVIDLRHLEDHNYAHPYQPVVGRPKKKSSVSKNIDTVDTDSDAETLSIAEDSLKLVPCLPESLSQEHCYCRRYQPTEDYSLDWSDADSDYQFPGDLHLSNTVDKLPEMMDMVDTFSRERGIADSSQPVRKRQKLSDVTNTSWSRELAGLLPKPVRVKFNSRGKDAEKCIELDILLNGLDWEDRDYIRRQYERLSLGSGRDMPEWIRKTHWSDHPITVKPEISTPRKRKWKHNNRRFDSNKCARTEIYTKIGRDEKMVSASNNVRDLNDDNDDNQLPVVNTVSESDLTLARRAAQQSREARSESRRWQTVLTSYCDEVSDLLKFNQLKFRKKILKFARSGIHDWGLFALERIAEGEMVIEYVGEVVRQTVADVRERRYVAKGIGSSYLFRIDSDAVVDATYQGNLSRFVNHSCMPNCYAKIITVESKKKIVIYSRRDIQMNEEITYDYKFPFEDVKIPCHCRASSCRGSLN